MEHVPAYGGFLLRMTLTAEALLTESREEMEIEEIQIRRKSE